MFPHDIGRLLRIPFPGTSRQLLQEIKFIGHFVGCTSDTTGSTAAAPPPELRLPWSFCNLRWRPCLFALSPGGFIQHIKFQARRKSVRAALLFWPSQQRFSGKMVRLDHYRGVASSWRVFCFIRTRNIICSPILFDRSKARIVIVGFNSGHHHNVCDRQQFKAQFVFYAEYLWVRKSSQTLYVSDLYIYFCMLVDLHPEKKI